MKPIQLGSLTEAELDELAATAPDGIKLEKMKLSLFAVNQPEVFLGFIHVGEAVLGGVLARIIYAWLWPVLKKRQLEEHPRHAKNISVDRTEVELTEGEISRVISEKIRIREQGGTDGQNLE